MYGIYGKSNLQSTESFHVAKLLSNHNPTSVVVQSPFFTADWSVYSALGVYSACTWLEYRLDSPVIVICSSCLALNPQSFQPNPRTKHTNVPQRPVFHFVPKGQVVPVCLTD
jgi:hypothetical protein